MRALVSAAALTSISTFVTLLVGIGRAKLVAITLGTAGVGVISQVNVAVEFGVGLVSIGFANAVIRNTALSRRDGQPRQASTFLATAYAVSLILAVPVIGLVIFAPQLVTEGLLGGQAPEFAVLVLVVATPLTALLNMERAALQGLTMVRYLAIASSVIAIVGLLMLAPLVLLFGLNGGLLHIALFCLAGYLINMLARRASSRQVGFTITPWTRPTMHAVRTLLTFGSSNAIAGVFNTATTLLVRTFIINSLGVDQNGIYQVAYAIPTQVMAVIFGTLSAYAFPVMSSLRDSKSIGKETNLTLRFCMLATAPLVTVLILFSTPLVVLLYSRAFLLAVGLLPLQLVGEFFKTVSWSTGLSLLGRGRLIAFTVLSLAWNGLFAGGSLLLLGQWGLMGVVASYCGAYVIHSGLTYVYQRRREGLRMTTHNTRLLACSCLLLAGAVVSAATGRLEYQALYTAIGLPVWALVGTTRTERGQGLVVAREWLQTASAKVLRSRRSAA